MISWATNKLSSTKYRAWCWERCEGMTHRSIGSFHLHNGSNICFLFLKMYSSGGASLRTGRMWGKLMLPHPWWSHGRPCCSTLCLIHLWPKWASKLLHSGIPGGQLLPTLFHNDLGVYYALHTVLFAQLTWRYSCLLQVELNGLRVFFPVISVVSSFY